MQHFYSRFFQQVFDIERGGFSVHNYKISSGFLYKKIVFIVLSRLTYLGKKLFQHSFQLCYDFSHLMVQWQFLSMLNRQPYCSFYLFWGNCEGIIFHISYKIRTIFENSLSLSGTRRNLNKIFFTEFYLWYNSYFLYSDFFLTPSECSFQLRFFLIWVSFRKTSMSIILLLHNQNLFFTCNL